MITLGVDLASRGGQTGLSLVCWEPGGAVTVEEPTVGRFSDDQLVGRIASVRDKGGWIGIDAPFGFPVAFTTALEEWNKNDRVKRGRRSAADPSCCDTCGEGWDPLIRRYTDAEVHRRLWAVRNGDGSSTWPLSSVVERITPTTLRCAELLTQLTNGPVDRIGLDARIIEVYPSAALALWKLDRRGYKKKSNHDVRVDLVRSIASELGIAKLADRFVESEDCIDALVAACVARAAACGMTSEPDTTRIEVSREGWIHLPKDGQKLAGLRHSASDA